MKNLKKLILVLFLLVSGWANFGYGEDKEVLSVESIKKNLGLSLYLQGGYTYNLKNDDSQKNDLRIFDHKGNSFILDLAQITFSREPMFSNEVGFKLKFSVGETAKWIHSRGLGDKDDEFDLTEAYLSYIAPLGKGLRFDFGKFVTFLGAEVIEAKDNPNYSRSFLFNYALAFTHTGLRISYPLSDSFSTSFYLVNGWDVTDDNNKGKTLGISFSYTPFKQLSMAFNFIYGPEQDRNNSNHRFLFDWVGIIKPKKNLSIIINTDYGTEEKATVEGKKARWYGIAGIVKYDLNDFFSVSLRLEYFKDREGVRTGLGPDFKNISLKEITLTPEFRLTNSVVFRPEFRRDWSNKKVFDFNRKKTQDTFAIGIMYSW